MPANIQPKSDRVRFEVEMYWTGKSKRPSVLIRDTSDGLGIPDLVIEALWDTGILRDLCKELLEAGEIF